MYQQPLKKAVEIAGGQAALGRLVGKTQRHVWTWINRDKKAPPELCIPIEEAVCGSVTRYELRPDVFGDAA